MTIYLGRQEYQSEQPTKGYQPIKGNIGMHDGVVDIRFVESSGAGKSRRIVRISHESFAVVAQAMMHANTEEAIKAFGAALHSGLPKPTKHWLPPRGNRECRTMQPLASAGPARASEQVKSPPAQSSRKLGSVVLLECT